MNQLEFKATLPLLSLRVLRWEVIKGSDNGGSIDPDVFYVIVSKAGMKRAADTEDG